MAVVLDTDHLTVIQRRTWPAYARLNARLSQLSPSTIQTTIISFEEQMRGWLAVISRARNQQRQVEAYRRLAALLKFFTEITVLDYNEDAVAHFENLSRSKVRIGSMDLKIAAIALSRDNLLLSSNLRDFRHIPKLRVEDWTTS